MSGAYKHLPSIYDQWQQSYGKDYTDLIFPKLLLTIRHYAIEKGRFLDLACGTGTLALKMARRRWRVWGIDGSEGMISRAREKCRAAKLTATFLRQDMRSFQIPEAVQLVTCFFDSLNHLLSERDLLRTLRHVFTCLAAGGYFVFDVNNLKCFTTVWMHTGVVHAKDFTMILENSFEAANALAKSKVTIFLKRDSRYEQFSEVVRERHYPAQVVAQLLNQVGFEVLQSEDFNFTDRKEVGEIKTWWVARKPDSR